MKIKINNKILARVSVFVLLATPLLSFAGIVPCDGVGVDKPCDFNAFVGMINGARDWVIGIAGVIATVTFAIAGVRILTNPDNPGERSKAIEMFKKSIYGMILLLCAWVIIYTVVNGVTKSNGPNYLKFLK